MDATSFTEHAKLDPPLAGFLKAVAEDAGGQLQVQEPQRYIAIGGADILIAVAAYALYRYLKDYFDRRRALNEVEIARQQERLIAALIEDGFPPDQAQVVAGALLKQIAERGADDPALKTATGLLGK